MLDIIAHLETNEHVSIVEVQRPRCGRCAMARWRSPAACALTRGRCCALFRVRSAKVEALISDLAVRAQSKYSEVRAAAAARLRACADAHAAAQIGAASETLVRASAALRVSAERSRRFFAELAELQHAARLLPASDAPSAHASFIFDVSFPGVRAPPPAEVQVLVGPSDTVRLRPLAHCAAAVHLMKQLHVQGSVCTIGVQPPAEGVDRVREVIRAKKAAHFHSTLTRHLRCATLHALPHPSPSDNIVLSGRRSARFPPQIPPAFWLRWRRSCRWRSKLAPRAQS